jgi:leader peptidase (prepilin peptidase)/N-methyltransferase
MIGIPLLFFIGCSFLLARIDLKDHRLPNSLVAFTTIGFLGLQHLFVTTNDFKFLVIGTSYFAIFLLMWLISKGAIGLGDVKFSFVCGLVIGSYEPNLWLINIWVMFALSALLVVPRLLCRQLSLGDRIAFGPFMAVATSLLSLNSLTSLGT